MQVDWSKYGISAEQTLAFEEAMDDLEEGTEVSEDWICAHLGITPETLDAMVEAGDFAPPIRDDE